MATAYEGVRTMKQALLDVILNELSGSFREYVRQFSTAPIQLQELLGTEVTICTLLRQVRNAELDSEATRVFKILDSMKNQALKNHRVFVELRETIHEVRQNQ